MRIPEAAYSINVEDLIRELETSLEGLSPQQAAFRLHRFGKNHLPREEKSLWHILFQQFNNIFFYILAIASITSIFVGQWTDFVVINFVIVFNVLIGFWQEMKADRAIKALKALTESQSAVLRGGEVVRIPSTHLVPGDIVLLHEGEIASADLRLFEASSLMVDESTLTGESLPIEKDPTFLAPKESLPYERKNILFAGTTIVRGSGKAVVFHTGAHTYFASIAAVAAEKSPMTPLTLALNAFAKRYALFIIVLFALLALTTYLQDRSFKETAYVMIAALVSAVPEGLPLVVTLALAIGALALAKKNILIRYLPSVETLGSATIIATDKTNTLTVGKMTVQETYGDRTQLERIAALCNDAHEDVGDPLDVALLRWSSDASALREKYPRLWSFAFDTQHRMMATLHAFEGNKILLIKGAFEVLRDKARSFPQEIDAIFDRLVAKGLRILACGTASSESLNPDDWHIDLIGLIAFFDPPKSGIREVVAEAKKAHLHILMITGDHPETAKAVGEEVGIWQEGDHVLNGQELEGMSEDHLYCHLEKATILARFLPEHKYQVVKVLQNHGEIVVVSGDGVNDIPALRAADLGIAVGRGSEGAKEAAKMIITDNNLFTIVEAIRSGRVIADNIRKIIYYLISTSIQEITLISLALFTWHPLPLSAVQILWINIITGGLQDKAFAFTKAEGNVMCRPPQRPEKKFFDLSQILCIFFYGLSVGTFCYFLYLNVLGQFEWIKASTILFTSLATTQWANGIQAQKAYEPFFKNLKLSLTINPWIFVGFGLGLSLQCVVLYAIPEWFHSVHLTLKEWAYPGIAFIAAFTLVELRKWGVYVFKRLSPSKNSG